MDNPYKEDTIRLFKRRISVIIIVPFIIPIAILKQTERLIRNMCGDYFPSIWYTICKIWKDCKWYWKRRDHV